jgi:hypothetical protein
MDIDQFYDSDPRRRPSREVSFGMNWSDATDPQHLWDLFWVADTGELCLMQKPAPPKWLPVITRHDALALARELGVLSHDVAQVAEHPHLLADEVRYLLDESHWEAERIEDAHSVGLSHPRHNQARARPEPVRPPVFPHHKDPYDEELVVEVLAQIPSQTEVERTLKGWEDKGPSPEGLAWLRRTVSGSA